MGKFSSFINLINKAIELLLLCYSSVKRTVFVIWRYIWLFALIPWRITFEVFNNYFGLYAKSGVPPYSLTGINFGLMSMTERRTALRDAVNVWWNPDTKSINALGLRTLADLLCPMITETYLKDVLGLEGDIYLNRKSHRSALLGAKILDINCGVGYLTEGLARKGAEVTGISVDEGAVMIARAHFKKAPENCERPNYLNSAVKDLEFGHWKNFDIVICSELLDHVENAPEVIADCCKMVRKDGCVLFTVPNRTLAALMLEIVVLEHIAGIVPYGTHSWRRYLKSKEIESVTTKYGFETKRKTGLIPVGITRKQAHWITSKYDGLWFVLILKKIVDD